MMEGSARRAKWSILFSLLISGPVLSGCAQSAAQAPVDPPTGEVAEHGQLVGSIHQEMILMSHAEGVVTDECMARKGWKYHDDDVDVAVGAVDTASMLTGNHIINYDLTPQEAAEQGYKFYVERRQRLSAPTPKRVARQHYLGSLSEQQRQAYQEDLNGGPDAEGEYGQGVGGPTEGCLIEARKQVSGPQWQRVQVLESELQNLKGQALQRVQSDPRLADAREAWRACMGDAGFDVDSPDAATDRFDPASEDGEHAASQSIGHDPSQAEIDLATADAECRQEAELHRTWAELVRRHRANVAAENPDALAEWQQLRGTFLPNVRELLGADTVEAVIDA
jgi:hypothetical protein